MEPRRYARKIQPQALVHAFLGAMVLRLPGLREVTNHFAKQLGTTNFSSLAPALDRVSSLLFVQRLIEQLCANYSLSPNELIAVDSMALTLPKTLRHRCEKYNNKTVGGGVLWSIRLRPKKGESPFQIYHLADGAWHDSTLLKAIRFVAKGPIYLLDRGFYSLVNLQQLLDQKVNFIMRARRRSLVYQTLKTLSRPCKIHALQLTEDALVRIGADAAKVHPKLRLLRATPANGDELILVTNRFDATAEELFAQYKKRWQIESFHRQLKDTIGLAHLYSFKQNGLKFLLHVALLLALILFFNSELKDKETLKIIQQEIKTLRKKEGVENPWKRNIFSKSKTKIKT